MKKFHIILIMVLLSSSYLSAQSEACKTIINDGITLFNSKKYAEAKVKFEAAKKIQCDGAQSWIDKCNTLLISQRKTDKVVENNRDQTIKRLQANNDSLCNINDSLLYIINVYQKTQLKRDSLRKIKEETMLTFKDPAFKSFLIKYYDKNLDGEISQFEAEEITKLEVSKQKISSLEGIENLSNLLMLNCSGNKLTKLDVSKNIYLEELNCCSNPKLLEVRISATQQFKDIIKDKKTIINAE